MTSHDVVNALRRILRQRKIGHTGTLDPEATGVLVVCLGDGTKLSGQLGDYDKEYIAVCRLGMTTDTGDLQGNELSREDVNVTVEDVKTALARFKGTYAQVPPMYSAIRHEGKHLYELAREGREVERKPRDVTIYAISLTDSSRLLSDNEFTFEVRCSKGTYIRTLTEDIGAALGCGATMAHLTRTAVGSFHIAEARTLSMIEALEKEGALDGAIMPIETFYRDLDMIHTLPDLDRLIHNGNAIPLNGIEETVRDEGAFDNIAAESMYGDGTRVRAYDSENVFCGIFRYDTRRQQFVTETFFYHI